MKYAIIAGSRGITDYNMLETVCCDVMDQCDLTIDTVTIVSGTARGVDQMGERFAEWAGCGLKRMPAAWDQFGKSAGYRRNEQMAKVSDIAIIFWDGKSKGTKHMINLAKDYELKLFLFNEKGEPIS